MLTAREVVSGVTGSIYHYLKKKIKKTQNTSSLMTFESCKKIFVQILVSLLGGLESFKPHKLDVSFCHLQPPYKSEL